MGCATSNQKPAETTAAAQTQEAKAETEQSEKAEAAEGAKGTESQEAEPEKGGYAVQPRSIKDRTLKVGLIPVTMNTAYTMTINGAKKQIEDKGLDIELLVQAPASNTSTITEQGNIMESMIQQGVDAIALEFAKGRGIGIVYCSPNERELASVCDRLYELAEGKVSGR